MKKISILTIAVITLISLSACQQEPVQNEIEPIPDQNPKSIEVTAPIPNAKVTSPIEVSGIATLWFFEAEFPIMLEDQDGNIIAQTQATAQSDWMTEEPVPFTATLDFDEQPSGTKGKLIFQKSNPSGLPEYDESFEIDVQF